MNDNDLSIPKLHVPINLPSYDGNLWLEDQVTPPDPQATHTTHIEGERWAYGTTFGLIISDSVTDSAGNTSSSFSPWPRQRPA